MNALVAAITGRGLGTLNGKIRLPTCPDALSWPVLFLSTHPPRRWPLVSHPNCLTSPSPKRRAAAPDAQEHAPDDARQQLAERVVAELELSFEIDEAEQVMRSARRPGTTVRASLLAPTTTLLKRLRQPRADNLLCRLRHTPEVSVRATYQGTLTTIFAKVVSSGPLSRGRKGGDDRAKTAAAQSERLKRVCGPKERHSGGRHAFRFTSRRNVVQPLRENNQDCSDQLIVRRQNEWDR